MRRTHNQANQVGAPHAAAATLKHEGPTVNATIRPAGDPATFQARVVDHLKHVCDGAGDPTDLDERRDRFGEEAIELFQSLGGTREAAHLIVDYVFGREIGRPDQEFGGTMTTLAGLAAYAGESLTVCGEVELARTWRPEVIAKIRRKRSNRHGRGPLPGNDADLVTTRRRPTPRTGDAADMVERIGEAA